MQAQRATYALILACSTDRQIEVGKLGRLAVRPGSYVYVGSAFGPGGLKARIAHHARVPLRPHWHIDYLHSILHLNEVWYSYDDVRNEHLWAETFRRLKGATIPMAGFGASDCSCTSHLFAFSAPPSIRTLRRRLGSHSKVRDTVFSKKRVLPDNSRS